MEQTVYIHAGFPKCASTTLQEHLFSRHPALQHFPYPVKSGKYGQALSADVRETGIRFFDQLLNADRLQYDPAEARRLLKAYVLDRLEPGKIPVLSHERLVSEVPHADRTLRAARLRELFPDPWKVRIVMVLRNQPDAIRSRYNASPSDPFCQSPYSVSSPMGPEPWLAWQEENLHRGFLGILDYHALARFYADLFGRENLGIFLFEEFVREKPLFVEKLAGFMGIDGDEALALLSRAHSNKSTRPPWHATYVALKSKGPLKNLSLGRYLPAPLVHTVMNLLHRKSAPAPGFSPEQRERIRRMYKDSNTRLQEHFGLPLEKYGYPL